MKEHTFADKLNYSNEFLESILVRVHKGIGVEDGISTMLVWNGDAEEMMWRPRATREDGAEQRGFFLNAVNRRGQPFQYRVDCYPFVHAEERQKGCC